MEAVLSVLCLLASLPHSSPLLIQEDEERTLCQTVYTTGYGYRQFIHLPTSSRLSNGTVLFKFEVMATSDAHVLLAPVATPGDADPVYEVVIGAGRNSFSDIRRLRLNPARKTVFSKGILSETSMKKFWIMAEGSTIRVGEEGLEPFLVWKDNQTIRVEYLSFCSWTGFNAKWKFDCRGATPVAESKTVSARLLDELFSSYDPYSVPASDDNDTEVSATLHIDHIHLDAETSSMEIKGLITLTWTDSSLQWEPDKYGNITVMRITKKEIWQPQLVVQNSAVGPRSPVAGGLVRVSYSGEVRRQGALWLSSLCPLRFDDWPADRHSCPVHLALASHQEAVRVNVDLALATLKERNTIKEWLLESLVAESVYRGAPWAQDFNQTVLTLKVGLKRHQAPFHHLLYVPVLVAMFILSCSLWLEPTNQQRVVLQVILMVMFVMMLICIDHAMPSASYFSSTPYIMKVCSSLILVNTACLLVTVWLSVLGSMAASRLPRWLSSVVNSPAFTSLNLASRKKRELNDDMGEEILSGGEKGSGDEVVWATLIKFTDRFLLAYVFISYAILLMF